MKRPMKTLELYEFEGCPFCKKVGITWVPVRYMGLSKGNGPHGLFWVWSVTVPITAV